MGPTCAACAGRACRLSVSHTSTGLPRAFPGAGGLAQVHHPPEPGTWALSCVWSTVWPGLIWARVRGEGPWEGPQGVSFPSRGRGSGSRPGCAPCYFPPSPMGFRVDGLPCSPAVTDTAFPRLSISSDL